ncbi:MAG TPA: class I mannose-6-phosphate isomerase [Bryobacteraceae bacterium]|nr:class I mannose-6-phosphate isomerase [Bryobacteraceae bacterium]
MLSQLSFTPHERVWGSLLTQPWYRNSERKLIGEVWFRASESVPLLVKFLFTSDRLSIQVHPGDDYARQHENSAGKTEMWHIVQAAPGSLVAAGLREPMTRDRLREACIRGDIVEMLNWVPVQKGDTFFIPAGTIHAIGAGVAVCEVQQLSDVTYRLFDYGRRRELHLERGVDVSKLEPANLRLSPQPLGHGHELLAECSHFRTERWMVNGSSTCRARSANTIYVVLEGQGTIGGLPFSPGDAFEAPAQSEPFEIASPRAAFLLTSSNPAS